MSQLHILGINGEQHSCDLCGREDLERTAVVADSEGEIVGRYGTSCVDIVIARANGTRKRRTTAQKLGEIEEVRKGDIFNDAHWFDRYYRADVLGQDRKIAIDALNRAIRKHNLIPIPATRKAIAVRIERLAADGSSLAPIMLARLS